MRGLAGKRVVVTGGTSGIGAATAQRFRDEGARSSSWRGARDPAASPAT